MSNPVTRAPSNNLGAVHPRTLGQRLRDVGWAGLSVGRQEGCAHQIVHRHERPHLLDLIGREEMHFHAEALCRGRQPLVLGPPVLIAGQPQAAGHFPSRGKAGFLVELLVEIDRIFEHLCDRGGRAQLADKPRGMPRRSGRQLVLLQQHHIRLVIACQVIGGGTADNAATDHDDFCMCGKGQCGQSAVGERIRACHT